MFTFNIRNIVAVGREGVKWAASAPAVSVETSKKSLQEQIVDLGKTKGITPIEFITKRKGLLESASTDELQKLKELAKAGKAGNDKIVPNYNKDLQSTIETTLATRNQAATVAAHSTSQALQELPASEQIRDLPTSDIARIAAEERAKKAAEADKKRTEGKEEIVTTARKEEAKIKIEVGASADFKAVFEKGQDNNLTVKSMASIIAAGDDDTVESKNVGWFGRNILDKGEQKFSFGELQIYNRLMANIKTPGQFDALATRIGAQPLPWITNLDEISIHRDTAINDFRDKMGQKVSEMASVGQLILGDRGAIAGLESVITGREELFKSTLLANKDGLIQAAEKLSNNQSGLEKFINTLAKIGILLPLGILSKYGLLLTADAKNVDKVDGTTGGLEKKFAQFGEAGNLAASIKGIGLEIDINTNDPSQRITRRTADFLKSLEVPGSDILGSSKAIVEKSRNDMKGISPEKQTKFETITNNYLSLQQVSADTIKNNSVNPKLSQDILADQTFRYLAQVEEIKGFQFEGGFAALSPGMAGAGIRFAKISTSFTQEGVSTSAAMGEAMATKVGFKNPDQKKAYIEDNIGAGLKYSYDAITKIESLTLPSQNLTPEAIAKIGASKTEEKDGMITFYFPQNKTFDVSNIVNPDGSQSIHIRTYDRPSVSSIASVGPAVASTDIVSTTTRMGNIRESKNSLDTMKDSIFAMSRDAKKYPEFNNALVAIGKGEYESANTILQTLSKKDKGVAKILEQFKEKPLSELQLINTYTYGARNSMKKESVSLKDYQTIRTPALIAAETKLGIWNTDAEDFFKSLPTHNAKNLSDAFPGQKFSVSVYATPKGGTHRIDTFTGSIQTSNSIYRGDFSEAQKDQILKNSTRNTQVAYDQFKKDFGAQFPKVTIEEYQSYLKSGTMTENMKGLVEVNKVEFFETRAMVQGNLCANKCEGIAYPAFSYKNIVPPPVPPTNVEEFGFGGAGTPGVSARVGQVDIGGGLGIRLNQEKNPEEPKPNNSDNSANTITGSENANGTATGIITNGPTATPPIKEVITVIPTPALPTPALSTPTIPGR